ncbi:MAG: hypothetical protein KDK90_19500 [Leptospiraceae bacterium]|nr:hypothetical protein [Leptospiraceae bacterium]
MKYKLLLFLLLITQINSQTREPIFLQKSNSHLTQSTTHQDDLYKWDDFAMFLAGMPLSKENKFYQLTQNETYNKHYHFLNREWNQILLRNIKPIHQWQAIHIPQYMKQKPVLYLLSGADFVNLYTFFPEASYYIMIGLEPPGIPSTKLFEVISIEETLYSIQKLVTEISARNYFTRRKLETEMGSIHLPGVTPILLVFMARMGLSIDGIYRVQMNALGDIVLQPNQDSSSMSELPRGVSISFYDPNYKTHKTLVYLQMSLDPESVTPTSPKGSFFLKQNRFNMLLKAAEYIFHEPKFNGVLKMIYSKMDLLVQDDSGIPYKMFDNHIWDVQVFGNYMGRIPLPRTPDVPEQKELKTLFKNNGKPLNFPYGYGILKGQNRSNLMLLIKRK